MSALLNLGSNWLEHILSKGYRLIEIIQNTDLCGDVTNSASPSNKMCYHGRGVAAVSMLMMLF